MAICRFFVVFAALLVSASPAWAVPQKFIFAGSVTYIEGDALGSDIAVGDTIAGGFTYDDAMRGSPTTLPLGGGASTIYSPPFTNFGISVGSYYAGGSYLSGVISYGDNIFGQDSITILLGGLPGGPFGSTFGNFQLQARGPGSAIDGSGAGNGLPYSRFNTSFFGGFSNGSSAKRLYGTLAINAVSSVPEPATWVMMICGVGFLGYQFRRVRLSLSGMLTGNLPV